MISADRGADSFLPSLTQLRAFVEVARLESIARASQELRRSQSAVTQIIQRLELDLGATLFVRKKAGSYLTEAGRILLTRADKCFVRIEASIRDCLGNASGEDRASAIARRITRGQIRALTAVYEHGSFAQAARYVQVSIPALQRSARSLEGQVGRELFANTIQGVRTNQVGAKLSGGLLLAARELDWASEEIRSQQGVLRGQLLVGSLLQAGNPYIAVGLDHFLASHPHADIKLTHGSYDDLLAKLQGGSIDFLIGLLKNPPPVDDVIEEPLSSDPYVIAVNRRHPLSSKSKVTLSDLRSFEWIAPRPTAQRRRAFEAIFEGGELPPYGLETHSLLTILVLLGSGANRIALMTLTELAVDQRLGNQLSAIKYPVNAPPAVIGVTMRRDWEPTRLQQVFLSFLRSETNARPKRDAAMAFR